MCGIYGRVGLAQDLDIGDCLRRLQILNHRGPDYCGTYSAGNVFLGHTRLSILDLTPAGNQPFGNAEAKLIFNGEIYNWKQLRAEHLADQDLHSTSDTEVLFHLLRKLGTGCLPLLNGMFAFAYYVPGARQLILARDMVGIKPLYFISASGHFEFSSEIKNLDYVPDLSRLKEYLIFARFGEDFLPFANVKEILPGSFLELDCATGRWSQQPYREVESLVREERYRRQAAVGDQKDQLDTLLQRSVAMHEQSDAPIGFLCSGGLDSSLISAIAARRHPDVALYHADFDGEGGEAQFADQVARHIGVPISKTCITNEEFWRMFPEITHALDLPVQHPHSVSLSMIARKARDDGLKVLLTGEGADELFGGYWWHQFYKNSLSNYSGRWGLSNVLSLALRKFLFTLEGADAYLYFKYVAPGFQRHAHVGFGLAAWSLNEPVKALSLIGQDSRAWARWQQALDSYSWLQDEREASVQAFMLYNLRYQLQPLLQRLDRMLMLHSIEGRVPFLENGLFEFGLNLPLSHKIRRSETKRLLKQVALRYLPSSVVKRRKMGFTVPWLTYSANFPKILEDGFIAEWTRLSRKDLMAWWQQDPNQLYKLIAIEVWGRIFVHRVPWQSIRVEV